MKIITSAENSELKEAKKLHDAKYRKEKSLFFFEGIHLLEEYLKSGKKPYRIFITEEAEKKYSIPEFNGEKRIIPQRLFDKITTENAPQGIFTVATLNSLCVEPLDKNFDKLLSFPAPSLVLESVRDPGNVGTIIRTAVSLGVRVIFTRDCCDIYSPKVIRSTMGAVFNDTFYTVSSAAELSDYAVKEGYRVYGAVLNEKAEKLGAFPIDNKSLFIIGNEGAGITKETMGLCNSFVYIPMSGKTESLNAAIASSIIMWEITRKGYEYEKR